MSGAGEKRPELLLEQLALGVISAQDERWLRAQLSPDEVERHVTQLRAEDADFVTEHDLGRALSDIANRQRAREAVQRGGERKRPWLPALVPALGLAIAAVWFARAPDADERDPRTRAESEDTTRVKGLKPYLLVFRRKGEQVEPLAKGAHAARGDLIQLGYVAAGATHGTIISLDGRGQVSLHFPDRETSSTRLTGQEEQLLGHAYELDAAPGFEHFVLVTAMQPIDVKAVLHAARELERTPERALKNALSLPDTLEQHAFTLVKE